MSPSERIIAVDQSGKSSRRVVSFLRIVGILLVLAAIGVVTSVWAVGLMLSAPAHAVIGPPPSDLRAEAVAISSTSGATLQGWFINGRPGGGAVVLMHGVHSNRLSMIRRARLLSAEWFSVLLFDFQAHGESSGTRITFGQREGEDAESAVAYVQQRLPQERIGAIGTSLGGAAALLAPRPLAVNALVLESVYSDIRPAITNRMRAALGPFVGGLVATPLEFLFEVLLPPVLGVNASDLRPIDRISGVSAPIFIASGTRDDRTTIDETNTMFARAREPKLFWAVSDARHVDLEAYAPDEYRQRILPFLVANLRR
jgi:uncharacterized protein